MRRALLVLSLLAGAAGAETAEDFVFRARHAQDVEGDLLKAIQLYKRALEDPSLDTERQAEVHLRLALCYEQRNDASALDHLSETLFSREEVPAALRRLADEVRTRIRQRQSQPRVSPVAPAEDPTAVRARRLADHLRRARSHMEAGDDIHAFIQIQAALDLDPGNPDARALESELDTRLSGVTEFVKDPLKFVKTWTEAQTKTVAREAEGRIKEALNYARKGAYNLARARFQEALDTIDGCEFARDSDELIDLRERVLHLWGSLHEKGFGPAERPSRTPRSKFVADFLNHLQRMLDVVSAPGQEYRIVPVAPAPWTAPERSPHAKPSHLQLLRHIRSSWSPALFARFYLPLRVHPQSWSERGNYLEAVGGMLVARNRPEVLDDLVREVRQIEGPSEETMRSRFVIVSVPVKSLERFATLFGDWHRSDRGDSPVLYRALPANYSLVDICSYLRDEDVDVKPKEDVFDVEVANGIAQTFFASVRLSRAKGYEDVTPDEGNALASYYGVLLDAYPLRNPAGRTALLLRLTAHIPASPLRTRDGASPRFLEQTADVFVDLAPGATLAVAGLADPFAAARGEHDAERVLLLLWENPGAGEEPVPAEQSRVTSEVPLRNLLFKVRDRPGPRGDERHGFVRRDPVEVLAERGRFLESLLRDRLGDDRVEVDTEEAVVRIPPAVREAAGEAVADLERRAKGSFVVRIQARAVRTKVFERWIEREGLDLFEFGNASIALSDAPSGEFLLRNLMHTEPEDVFAPRSEWPALTVLGLQARHALSARSRTSPAYSDDEDLSTGETRTVTEGLCVTVRPYRWRGSLRAEISVETQGLQSEVEELALVRGIPSYRTKVSGTRAGGTVDFGDPSQPRTALVCRIAHPTSSSLENLTEIVVAISVRPVP